MNAGKLLNVKRIDLPEIPDGTKSVLLSYEVEPPTGSFLVYRTPSDVSPVELPGPGGQTWVHVSGRSLWFQRIRGAQEIKSLFLQAYSATIVDVGELKAATVSE